MILGEYHQTVNFHQKSLKHLRPRVYPGQIPSYIEVNTQDFYRLGKTVPFPLLCSIRSPVCAEHPTNVMAYQNITDIINNNRYPHSGVLIEDNFRMRRTSSLLLGKVSILPVPVHLGQPHLGTNLSPAMLLGSGLQGILEKIGWKVTVHPSLCDAKKLYSATVSPVDDEKYNAKNCRQIGIACRAIQDRVYEEALKDNFVLMLGGDHSIPIGTIPAICKARPNTGVVWVDAHADINTPANSASGNIHGMPLGFLLGLVDKVNSLPGFDYFSPCLQPKDIVYIGLRDVDQPERDTIKRLGIKAYSVCTPLYTQYPRLPHHSSYCHWQ